MRTVPTIWVHRCSVRQVSRQASMHVNGRIDGHEVREGTRPAQCCHQPGHGREPVAVVLATWNIRSEKTNVKAIEPTLTGCKKTCSRGKI